MDSSVKKTGIVIPKNIEEEMKSSYLDYAMSVLVARALPDVRDGLKPVHRRILYAMHEIGLQHDKPFKKSARIIGNVLGYYHPHGDAAIYDALARMAQDFSLRYPLVNGQGNWGSIDGDAPAAFRYTEARLTKIAEELLEDIDKETVKFIPNFDGSTSEPVVLPAKIPNLLVNGSSGIAVGMATNIPPHNLGEVIDATIKQIENPDVAVGELMQIIKGPDFPTGAIIYGKAGLKEAYSSGCGSIRIRAKTELEKKGDRERIIVTEIPFQINKAQLVEQIAELVRGRIITGISDLRDESSKEGIRIVIELKKETNPELVLNQLFMHSKLGSNFGFMFVALVGNQPKTISLKQAIHHFINFRKEVVTKRTLFELNKAAEKEHLLSGIIIALENINPVIEYIKSSKDAGEARTILMKNFSLTELQANAILDMKLQRLASLEQEKVRKEKADLIELIKKLKELLSSEKNVLNVVKEELLEIKKKYADKRKTIIVEETEELSEEDVIEKEDVVVTITHSGYVKRLSVDTYKQQKRGGKGIIGAITKEGDFIEEMFIANTHSRLLFFTEKGKVNWLYVYAIPEASRQATGKALVNLLGVKEKITSIIPVDKFDDEHFLIMATKKGLVKKTNLIAYSKSRKGGIIGINLEQGDELVNVELTDGSKNLVIATKNGKALRFNEKTVRIVGRASKGVRGIRLVNDEVIGMISEEKGKTLLTLTENGFGKRSKIENYRFTSRAGKGVINIKCTQKNGKVIAVKFVSDEDELMLMSRNGIILRTSAKDISVIGRHTQGVRVMKLEQGDKLVAAAIVRENNG